MQQRNDTPASPAAGGRFADYAAARRGAARMAVAPGVDIAYVVDDYTDGWKNAPVVMLLHGVAESAEAFIGWVPQLARHCRVIRVDLRGHGLSSPVGEHDALSIADMADDIDTLARRIGAPVHVVGAKLGAQIGLELAQRAVPWMASLTLAGVLISPGGALGKWVPEWIGLIEQSGVEGWARATMPGRMGTALTPEGMAWWTRYMAMAPAATVKACIRMFPRLAEPARLESIVCPTQVIVAVQPEQPGAYDQRQPVAEVRRWQTRIPGSALVELQADSYHIAATHPDACAAIALRFIERISS
ncbi:alpha/beta fold hydrolase [Bordetella sp. H567]|uniref:alpha/beta fold hydrolase n=1 Tax=Bordetella sp. H567 TaxID=1697043 RepID=UPI00082AF3F9|nr:alpha/beta hydrolase [Bordetella sp. H567]